MTKIEWTDETWNPLAGCSVLSPGCTNCYAMREAGGRLRTLAKYAGLTQPSKAGSVWTGEVRLWETALDQPLGWKDPRRIFVNSMSDLFHEGVPDAWIDRIVAVMARCPQHQFQVLTKRAQRQRDYLADPDVINRIIGLLMTAEGCARFAWPLPNLWVGVSVEDQPRADERIPLLLQTPAAVRWISAEPMLGPISNRANLLGSLDWVVAGGESGPDARPMHPEWPRALRDWCQRLGVSFFFKQWGEWMPAPDEMTDAEIVLGWHEAAMLAGREGPATLIRVGKKEAGRQLDGRTWDEYPREERT